MNAEELQRRLATAHLRWDGVREVAEDALAALEAAEARVARLEEAIREHLADAVLLAEARAAAAVRAAAVRAALAGEEGADDA